MGRQLWHHLAIAAAAGIIGFTNLGGPALWDEDEPWYASCAREMLERGDWVVPYYNGRVFPDKPPLMYWGMILGFQLFGPTEWGARFVSAVCSVITALATYHLGRRLFSAGVGLWAGLIVPSSLLFTVSARAATVDSALTLATTLAMLALVAGGRGGQIAGAGGPRADFPFSLPRRWLPWAAFWACLGVAVLAKGPIGLLLPAASVGLFRMIANDRARSSQAAGRPAAGADSGRGSRRFGWIAAAVRVWAPGNFLRSLWQMRPLTGVAVVSAVAGPWFVLVAIREPEMLHDFLAQFNWRPFTRPILGHSGPFWYYVPAVLIGLFPWSAFLGQSLVGAVRRVRAREAGAPATVLLACWIGVAFVFWSVCRTKLPHYLLPTYPAWALLTACFLQDLIAQPQRVHWPWLRLDLTSTILVGVGLVIGFPIAAAFFVPGQEWLGLVGVILIAGGAAAMSLAARGRMAQAVTVFAVMSAAWVTAIFGFAALGIDQYQYAKPLAAQIRRDARGRCQIAGYRFLRQSLVFYTGQRIDLCREDEDLRAFLERSSRPYVITVDEHLDHLHAAFPGQFREVARRPRFLRPGQVIVLARRDDSHGTRTADRMTGPRK